jgi:DNA (cytosine-5)-methyltransferase 1
LAKHKVRADSSVRRKPRVISLFTGVGGLDFGFEAAGFETSVALELDSTACRTIRLNRDWPVVNAAIQDVSTKEILRIAGLKVGEADVLIGGPPCQPFSKSGYWRNGDSGRLDDPRANTLTEYLRVLRDTKPKTFLLENVPGLAFDSKSEGLQYLLKGIAEINRRAKTHYKVRWQILKAADYGVPQLRERVFLIGARDGADFSFPRTRFTPVGESDGTLPIYRTAWDAIGDLPPPQDGEEFRVAGKWGDLLPSIPEGNNYLWHTARGGGEPLFGWRRRYWSFLLKLAKAKPSWTIQAQPGTAIGPFHWDNRRLTGLEMCRLQTFPDGLKFDCGRSDTQRLIGNAVPSLLAEVLAREISRQLLGTGLEIQEPRLLPPMRLDCPAPGPIARVPRAYSLLIGNHSAHPGTGKGRSALARSKAQGDLCAVDAKSKAA